MLPQVVPQLEIPKTFVADYQSPINVARPRIACFKDVPQQLSVSPSQSDSNDDRQSPLTPPAGTDSYQYVHHPPLSPAEMYDTSHQSSYYHSAASAHSNYSIGSSASIPPYLSDSPSPVDVHQLPYLDNPSYYNNSNPPSLLDHRRMSEPSYPSANLDPAPARYQPFYPLHRTTSLRDLRQPTVYQSGWKSDDESHRLHTALDEPLSPLNSSFSGVPGGMPYSPIGDDHYGPSPPNTGTSSSSAPVTLSLTQGPTYPLANGSAQSPTESNSKTYSFVALPGNAVKKRPRRRYDEIERLYQCNWPDCTKAYGTLNHLNAHVTMQKHGSKRSPNEFKELRKQWRKAKKEAESPLHAARRGSLSLRRPDSDLFDLPSYSHHVRHPSLSQHVALQASISVPHIGTDNRYAVNVDDIRFPPDDHRDDQHSHPLDSYGLTARQRYGSAPGSVPASWHHPSSSSRSSLQHPYSMSPSSLSQQQLSQSLNLHIPSPHPQQMTSISSPTHTNHGGPMASLNRLPADSTLLTPLPGYEPPSLLPPLQTTDLASTFAPAPTMTGGSTATDGFDMSTSYEDDSARPSTGHASVGRGNGDEY